MIIYALAIAVFLTVLVSGNNTSAVVGTLIGSRILNKYAGLLIAATGYVAGMILEGQKLHQAAVLLFPPVYEVAIFALISSAILFVFAYFTKIPLSLTMALVGSAIGLSIRYHYHIPETYLLTVIAAWILAPVISIIGAYYTNLYMNKTVHRNVWNYALLLKMILIVTSFFTAFTLGANTLGFIANIIGFNYLTVIVLSVSIFAGTFYLSSGVIKNVGQSMYLMKYTNAFTSQLISALVVEVSTVLSIPMSNTQTLTAGVLGSGLSYKSKAIYIKPFIYIVIMWIISPILGTLMAYIL
ncbi:MAG: anion permease [Thermoplasmata archaeon]